MGARTFPYPALEVLGGYVIANKDDDASPNYYGYVRADGSWYILKETLSAGADTYQYAKGGPDTYAAAWAARVAGLTYDYYHNVF